MSQLTENAFPASLATVAPSPTQHYRTSWHYQRRARRGIIVRYEEMATSSLEIDVDGPTVTDAYANAYAKAEAEYRCDTRRFPGTLEFDTMTPGSVEEFAASDKRTDRFMYGMIAVVVGAVGGMLFYILRTMDSLDRLW